MTVFKGCYTALITPFRANHEVDYEGLERLVDFQLTNGASGILACGTTGESPTLDWNEHNKVTERIHDYIHGKAETIAGTGSNSTQEAIEGTVHAQHTGIKAVLLVDPYYNGPSSMEIRREYIEPVARQFPEMQVIPYVIPGRTGTQLLPPDLAILHGDYPNVRCVKEATGDLENMRLTRKFCGQDFDILSGDDDKTFTMMSLPEIAATGVVSVTSNITPRAISDMVHYLLDGNVKEAKQLAEILHPLFSAITVKTQERTPFGMMEVKARNPLATKTLMNIMGMPAGPCRQPLGKMTRQGLEVVLQAVRSVYEVHPEIFKPIEQFFNVDLMDRLNNKRYLEALYYG